MRSRLLDAASVLFKERGLSGVSIADVAAAADAFPSQITYYFRTKEALFVEAACRDVLYAGRAAEQAAADARHRAAYTRRRWSTASCVPMRSPFFAEALTLTRRRQDLAPLIERTIERLHAEGVRAYEGQMQGARLALAARAGDLGTSVSGRLALGVALEGHATGRSDDGTCCRDAARARRAGRPKSAGATAEARRRRLVAQPYPIRRHRHDRDFVLLARDIMSAEQLADVRERSAWKGIALIVARLGADARRPSRCLPGGPIR